MRLLEFVAADRKRPNRAIEVEPGQLGAACQVMARDRGIGLRDNG